MPSVKRYSTPQVEQARLPDVQTQNTSNNAAFGLDQKTAEINNNATDMVLKFKAQADQLAVLDASNQLAQAENDMLYNEKTGAFTKKGKDAFALPDEVNTNYNKVSDDIESKLSNESQKAAFRQQRESRKVEIDGQIQRHVYAERKQYDTQVTESFKANERNAAVQNYLDPKRVQTSIERQQAADLEFADRNGLPEEAKQQLLGESVSKTHAAVIDRMLNTGMDLVAKKYFDEHKDKLNASELDGLEKRIEVGSTNAAARIKADEIFKNYSGSMAQAMEQAKKIEDTGIYDATVQRLKDAFNQKKIEKDQYEEKLYSSIFNDVDKNGFISDATEQKLHYLPPAEIKSIREYARIKQTGGDIAPNGDTYIDAKFQAATPELREKFMQTNPQTWRSKVSKEEFKELLNLQIGLKKSDVKTVQNLDGIYSDQSTVDGMLKAAGIDPAPKKGQQKANEKLDMFKRALDSEVKNLAAQKNRKLTNQELRGITGQLLTEVYTDKIFGFNARPKKSFELTGSDKMLDINFDSIPQSYRDLYISDYKRKNNREPTREEIKGTFLNFMRSKYNGRR